MDLHVVVMAGGSGERLWPLSRRSRPKPLLPVNGRRTLLGATLARARGLAGAERVWLVCTAQNAAELRRASGLPRERVLVEPCGRNTAMAVGYAALAVARRAPDATLLVLPADHVIPDARAFAVAARRAARAAHRAGALVTLGVRPTRPETGYGYIQVGAPAGRGHPGLHRVRRFAEKPDAARARRYLASGDWLWNAGIFAWRADAILAEIARHDAELGRALAALRRAPRLGRAALERAYRRAPARSIDVAVLERSDRVWTLPIDFHWSDVGSWQALAGELGVDGRASRVVAGEAWLEGAPGNLVWGAERPIVLLGVEGLAVIDAGDALLVARLDRSGDVRRIVARLREAGRERLL